MAKAAKLKKAPRVKKSSAPIRKKKAIANKKPKAAGTTKQSIIAVILHCVATETQSFTDLAISRSIANFSKDPNDQRYASATMRTFENDARRRKYEAELAMAILGSMKDLIVPSLLALEVGPQGSRVPVLFCVVGGDSSALNMRRLASLVIFRWILERLLERTSSTSKYLEPNMLMTYVHTLMGQMKDVYDWNYAHDIFFNFSGMFCTCL